MVQGPDSGDFFNVILMIAGVIIVIVILSMLGSSIFGG